MHRNIIALTILSADLIANKFCGLGEKKGLDKTGLGENRTWRKKKRKILKKIIDVTRQSVIISPSPSGQHKHNTTQHNTN